MQGDTRWRLRMTLEGELSTRRLDDVPLDFKVIENLVERLLDDLEGDDSLPELPEPYTLDEFLSYHTEMEELRDRLLPALCDELRLPRLKPSMYPY